MSEFRVFDAEEFRLSQWFLTQRAGFAAVSKKAATGTRPHICLAYEMAVLTDFPTRYVYGLATAIACSSWHHLLLGSSFFLTKKITGRRTRFLIIDLTISVRMHAAKTGDIR